MAQIDLASYEAQGRISIIDVPIPKVMVFQSTIVGRCQVDIHPGEKEMLAFAHDSTQDWLVCSGDAAVFRVLGFLHMGDRAISLEEILSRIGLSRTLEWKYTKGFRDKYTRLGEIDRLQTDPSS